MDRVGVVAVVVDCVFDEEKESLSNADGDPNDGRSLSLLVWSAKFPILFLDTGEPRLTWSIDRFAASPLRLSGLLPRDVLGEHRLSDRGDRCAARRSRELDLGLEDPDRSVILGAFISLFVERARGNFTGLPTSMMAPLRCLTGVERLVAERVRMELERETAKGDEQVEGERRRCRDGDCDVGWLKSVAVSPWWRWGE